MWRDVAKRELRDGARMLVTARTASNDASPPVAMVGIWRQHTQDWRSVPGDLPIYPVRCIDIPQDDGKDHG